ncbi:MAG: phospholipid carrier-dependent glycosyltransferase [Planctomycetota bacterium]
MTDLPPLPGPSRTPLPSARALAFGLLPLLGVLLLVTGTRTGLVGSTETRYAEIAREMLARGDAIVPVLNGAPHLEKPPFTYWALMGSYLAFGVNEVAARLPSLLAAALTLVVAARAARRLAPPGADAAAVGRGAAVALGTMPAFLLLAQTVSTDMWLVLCTTVAGAALLDADRTGGRPGLASTLAWHAALGVGFLVKGPAVLLTPLVGAAGVAVARRSLAPLRPLVHPLGLLLFAGLAVPWYLLAEQRLPGLLDVYLARRAGGGVLAGAHHDNPVYVVWLPVVLGTAPWGGTLFGAVPALHRRRQLVPLAAMALATPVFFTIAASRLFTYVMPALPFVAIAAAAGAPVGGPSPDDGPGLAWRTHGRRATLAFAAVVVAAAVGLLVLFVPEGAAARLGVKGYVASVRGGIPWHDAAVLALAGLGCVALVLRARGRGDAWTTTAGPLIAGSFVLLLAGAYPQAPQVVSASRHVIDPVLPSIGPDDEIGVAVHKDGDWALLPFYAAREARWFGYGERLGVKPPGAYAPRNFLELDGDLEAWFRAPQRRWLFLRTKVKGASRDPWPRLGPGEVYVVAKDDLYTVVTNLPPPR